MLGALRETRKGRTTEIRLLYNYLFGDGRCPAGQTNGNGEPKVVVRAVFNRHEDSCCSMQPSFRGTAFLRCTCR